MGIQSIGYQTSFKGKAITHNGNEYDKTHNGKLIGTGTGAAISAVMLPATNSLIKNNEIVNEFYNKMNKIEIDGRKFSYFEAQEQINIFKYSKNTLLAFLTLLTLGIGLGIGAIIDSSKNKDKVKRADLLASENIKPE